MDIVIDASTIIAVIANEPERSILIQMTSSADLIAPASIHFEIGNAFSAMLKRRRITLAQTTTALQLYQSIPIRFVDVELLESVQIAAQYDIYAYDAFLIRCAEKYRSPLLTLDRTLHRHAKAFGISTIELPT